MPLYLCRAREGAIDDAAKAEIAEDITRIHCDVTGAPRVFVNVFFFDVPGMGDDGGATAHLHGSIRAGRTAPQKDDLTSHMRAAIEQRSGVAGNAVETTITDTPASWVMEGGEIFPEPGEEAAWLAKHGEKLGLKFGVSATG